MELVEVVVVVLVVVVATAVVVDSKFVKHLHQVYRLCAPYMICVPCVIQRFIITMCNFSNCVAYTIGRCFHEILSTPTSHY